MLDPKELTFAVQGSFDSRGVNTCSTVVVFFYEIEHSGKKHYELFLFKNSVCIFSQSSCMDPEIAMLASLSRRKSVFHGVPRINPEYFITELRPNLAR